MLHRLVATLGARPALLLVLAAALAAPSLLGGLAADDRFHLLAARGELGPWWGPWNLFSFFPDDDAARAALRARGVVGWWASPALALSFWRPLASLSHWLDYRLLGDRAWLMHAQNVAWYVAVVALATRWYRRVLPAPAWAWAALLYVVDDAHGVAVGWIASRNALVSAAFGIAAVHAHLDALDSGRGRWKAPLLFLGSLLAAEAGVAWLGYPVALALARRRVGPVFPWLVALVAWRLAWRAAGGGLHSVGGYLDPVADPVGFALALGPRVAVSLLAQLTFVQPELLVLAGDLAPALTGVAVAVVGGVAWIVLRTVPAGRVWALGALLACVPLSAGYPQDRMLLPVGLGVFAALGAWLAEPGTSRGLARVAVAVHVVFAAVAFPLRSLSFALVDRLLMDRVEALPEDRPAVILSTAVEPVVMLFGALKPGTVTLAAGQAPLSLRRTAEDTLAVRSPTGWMPGALDRMMRVEPFAVGETATTSDLAVRVTELTADGRPAAVEVRGDLAARAWFAEREGRLGPVDLPGVGGTLDLPAPGMPGL